MPILLPSVNRIGSSCIDQELTAIFSLRGFIQPND